MNLTNHANTQGCKRDLFYRDRDETEVRPSQIFPETETRPRPSILASRPDRDVFQDLANTAVCKAFRFKLLQIMLCFVHLLRKTQFSIGNCSTETFAPFSQRLSAIKTRKPSYRWQTRATRKRAKNCSNSTCLQRCRWQYWPIFMRLAAVASEICEIPRISLKIQTYEVQGHPRSSILVPIESPYVTCY